MHARELVELAGLVAAHGPALIESDRRIPAGGIEQYWTSSKVRLDRWARCLKDFGGGEKGVRSNLCEAPSGPFRQIGPDPFFVRVRGTLEEILTGEVLTRVWTAVLCAHDRRRLDGDAEAVARSVIIGHIEARHRALTLLTRGQGMDAETVAGLNRLRRRAERWSDLLVGYLAGEYEVGEFAVDPGRARDFADDLPILSPWPLALASLRAAFRRGLNAESPNADLNARIAASILACFPPEVFDSTGLFSSLRLMRLTSVTEDVQGMIEELLEK
jgi:hypothetical protein